MPGALAGLRDAGLVRIRGIDHFIYELGICVVGVSSRIEKFH